jgi:hypothetical protein
LPSFFLLESPCDWADEGTPVKAMLSSAAAMAATLLSAPYLRFCFGVVAMSYLDPLHLSLTVNEMPVFQDYNQ